MKNAIFLTCHTLTGQRNDNQNYTENEVLEAIKAIDEGRMSLRDAELSFGVPKSTIDRRKNGAQSRSAWQTALSSTTEKLIVDLLGHLADIRYGLNQKMV